MGGENSSRRFQTTLNRRGEWMRATKHLPRGPFSVLERIHGFADIVERGACVHVERRRVNSPHLECEFITLTKNTSRHRRRFTQQRPGLFEAL